jgi:alkanesulfonate monooxygenase SsuD/methylene tetrahydromethanopterin reductase-like flavin-dependent oxidoreductase (luciferase family)
LGKNAIYAIIGGFPLRFAPLIQHYRETAEQHGHDVSKLKVGIAGFGLIGSDAKLIKEQMYPYWQRSMSKIAAERGFAQPNPEAWQVQVNHPGAFMVGSPSEIVDRMLEVRDALGIDRYILQMDLSNVEHSLVMKSIELLGTEVAPALR